MAGAHAVLVSTAPDRDAEIAAGPQRVSATFNEKLQTTFAAMNVIGPDGEHLWSTDDVQVDGPTVSVGLRPWVPPATTPCTTGSPPPTGTWSPGPGRSP